MNEKFLSALKTAIEAGHGIDFIYKPHIEERVCIDTLDIDVSLSAVVKVIEENTPHWTPIEEAELKNGEKYDIFTSAGAKYHGVVYEIHSGDFIMKELNLALEVTVTHVMKPIPDPL